MAQNAGWTWVQAVSQSLWPVAVACWGRGQAWSGPRSESTDRKPRPLHKVTQVQAQEYGSPTCWPLKPWASQMFFFLCFHQIRSKEASKSSTYH